MNKIGFEDIVQGLQICYRFFDFFIHFARFLQMFLFDRRDVDDKSPMLSPTRLLELDKFFLAFSNDASLLE